MAAVTGPPPPPLEELARRAADGDRVAFETMALRLQPSVYRLALHFVRDPFEANDLSQEIYLLLYRKLGRYDCSRPFAPWFWKLAANAARNYLRRRVPAPTDHVEQLSQAGATPDLAASSRDLALAVAGLPQHYREPIVLHYFHGRSLREIADAIGGTEPAVRSRLHRARAALGFALRPELS